MFVTIVFFQIFLISGCQIYSEEDWCGSPPSSRIVDHWSSREDGAEEGAAFRGLVCTACGYQRKSFLGVTASV